MIDQEYIDQILRDAFNAELNNKIDDAIELFKRASKLGSNDARSKLGTIYGDVLNPPNISKSVYWYKKAVENGDASCAWNLAMYYAGLGRKRGCLHWLRVATEMGDQDAKQELIDRNWWNKRNAR